MSQRRNHDLRLFVGAYPAPDSCVSLLGALDDLSLPPVRAVAPDQLHLTVHFIGPLPREDFDAACESLDRAASGIAPFSLTPTRCITLPARGRPRLVALETDAPAPLLELKRRLAGRFSRTPRARPADRFTPHFTLCRFRHGPGVDRIDSPVDIAPIDIRDVRLMRSVLSRDGAMHTTEHEVRLRA